MANKKKTIGYITGTRADFGLMTPILAAIEKSKKLRLQIFATGMHLMPQFGRTIQEVEKIFPQVIKVPATFDSDNRAGMARFAGNFLPRIISAFIKHKPDIVLLLGDRVEMLTAAISCLYLGLPVAHVQGGDKTTTVDDIARNAISKIAQIHFPATKDSAKRLEQMGEERWRIHIVGEPSLDVIGNEKLPSRKELFKFLNINPREKIILLTQHAVNGKKEETDFQIKETLKAIKSFNLPIVAIYPNADAGGGQIIKVLEKERKIENFFIYPSLNYRYFLALEREAVVWVGNSSSGIFDSPSFPTPVVNIGKRQLGRKQAKNIINADYNHKEIKKAIKKALFDKNLLKNVRNPWGDGKTGPRVAKILEKLKINTDGNFQKL